MSRSLARLLLVVLALCLLHARAAGADTASMVESPQRITFPLGEHYRVGKFLPVRVVGSGTVVRRVDVEGVLKVTPAGAGWTDVVVPVLAIGTIPQDGWSLRPLADDERLIGATTPDTSLTAELFPGKRVVDVSLDLSNPLPGPAMAWGALDAVLLDAAAAARVSEGRVVSLRAGGTAVAVRSEARPAGEWAWEQRGAWWVLPPDPTAVVPLIQPNRYGRVGEAAGAPVRFRRVIVISLVCFSLSVLAASLWRSRRAWMLVAGIGIVAAAGLVGWNARQPTSTLITTESRTGVWLDRYTQHIARADGAFRHPIASSDAAAWPIFFSHRHAQDADLHLECAADGTPQAFAGSLKRGQSIVFLTRSMAGPVANTTH